MNRIDMQRVEGAINWWLGDWYNYGEGTYGEIADQAVDELGLSYETVSQCIRVARNFSPETRVFELPWTHYREVRFYYAASATPPTCAAC